VITPASLTVPEGQSTTNVVSIAAIGLTPLSVDFAPNAGTPPWARFDDFTASGTNPMTRRLVFRPSFEDAGEYALVLRVTARRASSTVISNLTLAVTVSDQANAAFTRWARPQSGLWSHATNWTAGVPGIGTNAVIDAPGNYTVTLDADAFVESLNLGAASGAQVIEAGQRALTLNASSRIGTNGALRLSGVGTVSGQGRLAVSGRVLVESGALGGSGLLDILPTGRLEFYSPTAFASRILSRPVDNRGLILLSNAPVLMEGVITNQPGAQLVLDRSDLVWRVGTPRLENRGQWIKRGTATNRLYYVGVSQKGILQVEAGELVIEGGAVDFAAEATSGGPGSLRLWTANGVVQSALEFDDVSLVGSTVTNHAPQAWAHLVLRSSTLDGSGDVTVSERLELQASFLRGTGAVTVGSAAEWVMPEMAQAIIGRPFELLGRGVATNASLAIEGVTLLNRGRMEFSGPGAVRSVNPSGESALENAGQLVKSGGGLLGFYGVHLINSRGTVDVLSGALTLDSGGANDGAIHVAAGASLSIGGDMTHPAASFIGGAGAVEFSSGEHDHAGDLQPAGGLTVRSGNLTVHRRFEQPVNVVLRNGTLRLLTPQDFSMLEIFAGALQAAEQLTVIGSLNWSGGMIGGAGGFLLQTNGMSVIQSGIPTLGGLLENRGTIRFNDGGGLRFAGGVLHNRGRVEWPGRAHFTITGSTSNLFLNDGLLQTGTNTVSLSAVPFHTRGTHELTPVAISLGKGTNETALTIPAGGELIFNDAFTHEAGSLLGGAGTIEFRGGQQLIHGAFAPEGDLRFRGAEVRVRNAFTHTGLTSFTSRRQVFEEAVHLRDVIFEGGSLALSNRLTISRSLEWQAGQIEGGGVVRLEPTATAIVQGYSDKGLSGTFESAGEVRFESATRLFLSDATWHVLPGSTNRFMGDVQLWVRASQSPLLRNDGVMIKSGPGTLDLDAALEHSGLFDLAEGMADFGGGAAVDGGLRINGETELALGRGTHVFRAGALLSGTGTVRFRSGAVVELEAPLDLDQLRVLFESSTRVAGEFPMASGPGGHLGFSGGTIEIAGALDVRGRMEVAINTIVRVDDELRLHAGAVLDNQGRRDGQNRGNIRVRGFPDLGGSVAGIAPDVIPPPGPLRVGLQPWAGAWQRGVSAPQATSGDELRLRWEPAPGGALVLEVSEDLVHWEPVGTSGGGEGGGMVTLRIRHGENATLFFRLRETRW
jgi:phage baseplate assembly protein gpV